MEVSHSPIDYAAQERWEEVGADYAKQQPTGSQGAPVKRFIPFSQGSRDCAGQSLARMNYATTVAMLVANFSFKLAPEVGSKTQCCSPPTRDSGGQETPPNEW